MSPLSLFLISFVLLFLLGMPIAASMITSSFLYALTAGINLAIMGTRMFTGLNNFALIAIPLFILTAEVINRTSVSNRIFGFCRDMVGYIPGGMGHVNIVTSIIFAGMSGSAVADAGGIGNLYDRIIYGYVVDFIRLDFINFAIFNPADVFICVGAGIAALSVLLADMKGKKNHG